MSLPIQAFRRDDCAATETLLCKEEATTAAHLQTLRPQQHSSSILVQPHHTLIMERPGNSPSGQEAAAPSGQIYHFKQKLECNGYGRGAADASIGQHDHHHIPMQKVGMDFGGTFSGASSDNCLRCSISTRDFLDLGSYLCKEERINLVLESMDTQEAYVSPESLHGCLQKCIYEKDLDLGIQTHHLITKSGLESDALLGSQLIHFYASFGLLTKADQAFSKLVAPDIFSWSAIISAHGKLGQAYQAIFLYHQMLKAEVEPDGHAYVAVLKVCANAECMAEGRQIHSHVIAAGYELDDFVGSTIMDMYVKCGCLPDACTFFYKLPSQNVVMWSALIVGLTQHGHSQDALHLFQKMYQQGLEPNEVVYACVLKTCASITALEQGMEIHNCIIQSGFEYDVIIGNTLVDMYVKCGRLEKANSLFKKLPQRNVITWSTLIGGCTQYGYDWEALDLFRQMQVEGFEPDQLAFTCLLKACVNSFALEEGRQIHSHIIERGWESDLFISSTLIQIYTECGCLLDAYVVFSKVPSRDVVTWNVLISGWALHGNIREAWSFFEQMRMECSEADPSSFVCILKACSGSLSLAEAKELHIDAINTGFELDSSVGCSLMDMYIKCGSIENAQMVFNRLPYQDIITWSALIVGYAQLGDSKMAFYLFDQMQNASLEPNQVTFIGILKACSLSSGLEQGRLIHGWTIKSGLEMDNFVSNALVDMYAKCGSLEEARTVFNRLLSQDVVSWSALIAGHAEHGQGQEALSIFQKMQQAGVDPNEGTYVCALKACCNISADPDTKLIHSHVVEHGFVSHIAVSNSLVDVYTKCGNLKDACLVFNRMSRKDTITWNSLIGGYAKHGYGQDVLQIFQQMQHERIEPDQSTFIFILKACSTAMALGYGRGIHAFLIEKGWESDFYVCACLIDMYSKCGSLSDASILFQRSTKRDTVVWSSLIAGYAQHNDYNSCLFFFRAMLQESLIPDSVTYVSLLSACSHVGLLEEGCSHLRSMVVDFAIIPGVEHFNALANLFSSRGYVFEAEDLLESLPFGPNIVGWTSLLGSCAKLCDVNVARRCFEHIIGIDSENASGYVLMSRIYTCLGMFDAAEKVEKARRVANIRKLLARACIEIDKEVHVFVVGDTTHPQSEEILTKLRSLTIQSKEAGYRPFEESVLHEDASCGHCEKLAIAFGLLNVPEGASIRVSKNMRVCEDCHTSTAIISKIERREIIITDSYCVHHFKDGECTCRGYG